MADVCVVCSLMGDKFSPKKLERISNLQLIDKEEEGSIGKMGIYKDKPIPQGSASLKCSYSEKERAAGKNELISVLNLLQDNYEQIRESGVDSINLTLIIGHPGDGSCWYLEHEELKKIVDLGIGLSIDWYQMDDESA